MAGSALHEAGHGDAMKTHTFADWSWWLTLVLLAVTVGCGSRVSSPPAVETASAPAESAAPPVEDATPMEPPSATDIEPSPVEPSPTEPIPEADTVPAQARLSGPASEILRLAGAGVSERMMLTYINRSTSTFNLGADAVIYLANSGVPSRVISAMLRRDRTLLSEAPVVAVSAPPAATVVEPTAVAPDPPSYSDTVATDESTAATEEMVISALYDSTPAYGGWAVPGGYDPAWQTTYASDPEAEGGQSGGWQQTAPETTGGSIAPAATAGNVSAAMTRRHRPPAAQTAVYGGMNAHRPPSQDFEPPARRVRVPDGTDRADRGEPLNQETAPVYRSLNRAPTHSASASASQPQNHREPVRAAAVESTARHTPTAPVAAAHAPSQTSENSRPHAAPPAPAPRANDEARPAPRASETHPGPAPPAHGPPPASSHSAPSDKPRR